MATTVSARTLQGLIDSGDITREQIADKVRAGEIAVLDDTIAGLARGRLASQGLTLDQVKANPIEPVSHPSMLSEIANDQNATKGTGATLTGMALAIPKMIASVGDIGANSIVSGINAGVDMAGRFTKADQDYGNDPIRRGVSKTLASVPIVGGAVQDLLQPSMIAPNREPTPAEREAAGGAAVNLGAMASGPAIKGILGKGAPMEANAVNSYARGVSTPLTESLVTPELARQMMDQIGVVNNTAKVAAGAESAAANSALDASATQAVLDATPKPRGTVRPNGVTLDAENSALASKRTSLAQQHEALVNDATFQSNVKTVMDGLSETAPRTVGNILTQAGTNVMKRGLGGEVVNQMVDHLLPKGTAAAVVSVFEATKALKSLVSTPAFRTATAMAKRSFARALQSGDLASAGEIGAGIASGSLAEDVFGHRKAVQSLSGELAQYDTPDQKRQVVAAKKWVYVDPKSGAEIALPQNVMTAFTNSPKLTETSSPVQAYVDAMIRQGKLTKGGKVEFR